MRTMADSKYRAFLSYSHADTRWARWLHRRLEGFRLRELAGRQGLRGAVPPGLAPIFRDREEFTAGHSLSDQTLSALDASEALIVLCSPAAAVSRYVNEEIRLFKSRLPRRLIVPVIADGKPGDPELECFPPALRFKVGVDGVVTGEREPDTIAADLRETGDGSELALAKTVAALVGLPPDQVYQRAERERRRQLRIRAAVAAGFVLLSGAGAYYLWQSQRQGVVLLDTAAACARYLPANPPPSASPLGALDQCIKSLEALRVGAASDPRDAVIVKLIADGKTGEAERLQLEAARDDEAAGKARNRKAAQRHRTIAATAGLADPRRAREHYAKAARLDPEDAGGIFLHGQAERQAGNLGAAEKAFETVLRLKDSNVYEMYHSLRGLGTIELARGELDQARKYYEQALRAAKELADLFPGAAAFQRGLSLCYADLGGVLRQQGDLDGALRAYRDALSVAQRLASPSSTDRLLAGHLATMHRDLASALVGKKEFGEAMEAYRQSIDIYERLAKAHPQDISLRRSLSTTYQSTARALLALGRQDEALKMSVDGLDIMKDLAASDRDYPSWRILLSSAHDNLGDVLRAQRKTEEALKAYRDSVAALEQPLPDPTDELPQLLIAETLWKIAGLTPDPRTDGTRAIGILEGLDAHGRLSARDKRSLERWKAALAKVEILLGIQRDDTAAQTAFDRRDYSAAFERSNSASAAAEKLETGERGAPGIDTGRRLGQLSWFALFARRFDDALAVAERGLALDRAATWIETNRAHALMFLGRAEEAKALYLALKGTHVAENNKAWEEVIADDFAEFQKADLTHPQMEEIRRLLGATEGAVGRP